MQAKVESGETRWGRRFRRLGDWINRRKKHFFGVLSTVPVIVCDGIVRGAHGLGPAQVVACAVAAAFAAGVASTRPYEPHCQPSAEVEREAAHALGVGYSGKDKPNVRVNNVPITATRVCWEKTDATRKWVQRVKLHFGQVTMKPADQLCVKRWLGEQMKAEDMRDSDARALVPVVAVLSAVPDADDLRAVAMVQSSVVQAMLALGGPGGA